MNDEVRKLSQRPALFGVNSSGLYGFAWIDFGEITYEFKTDETMNSAFVLSKSLKDYLEMFCKPESKLDWNKR